MKKEDCWKIFLILSFVTFFSLNMDTRSNSSLNDELLSAVYEKDYVLIEKLINNGADIDTVDNEKSLSPITIAAIVGDVKLVEFLLKKGADIHGKQEIPNLPIYLAISNNHLKVVKKLIDSGISPNYAWPNQDGGTLLITAVQLGHAEMVKLLIELGANMNFCGNGDYSPLYRSIIYDHFDVFEYLIKKGAYLSKKDISTLSELGWWEDEKNSKYIKLLKQETG